MKSRSNEPRGRLLCWARVVIAVASAAFLISLVLGGESGAVVALVLTPVFPLALMVLGAAREGRLGPIALPLVAVAILLEGGLVGMLVLRGHVVEGVWIAGLPLAANVLIYGMWIVPFAIVALTYALTFDRFTLTEDDLRRFDESIDG